MFNTLLIANRGEIACRIIKTAKILGIKTIAVFSKADSQAEHVKLADEAHYLGDSESRHSYLNIKKIITIAKKTKTEAIHPGYGFLSENEIFADACDKANIVFIGPPTLAIKQMGSKSIAKSLMEKANVPIIPGYHGQSQTPEALLKAARNIGFPVLLKPSAGGGGKGMRAVFEEENFLDALNSAKREAKSSFNNSDILIEKLLSKPRHIEVQIFADSHGNIVHLFERDCSIQRRHQKIVEEAPAYKLNDTLRKKISEAAIIAAKTINYVGAGTVEFLLAEDNTFYFMEMNTRLQVEHPVTEMVTGLNLVYWQLLVANGDKLPLTQKDIKKNGHAIEVRLYAEDPDNHFLPSTGKIAELIFPKENEMLRIDTGIAKNNEITIYYDPMLAKLIIKGKNRQHAINLLKQALLQCTIIGIKTNIAFLLDIVDNDFFIKGNITTDFLDTCLKTSSSFATKEQVIAAALYYTLSIKNKSMPWHTEGPWQMHLPKVNVYQFISDKTIFDVNITHQSGNSFILSIDGDNFHTKANLYKNQLTFFVNEKRYCATLFENKPFLTVHGIDKQMTIERFYPEYTLNNEQQGQLTAPMPGTVVAVNTKKGKHVSLGEKLMVIEAMKMEHSISSPSAGEVKCIYFNVGDKVNEGEKLIDIVVDE